MHETPASSKKCPLFRTETINIRFVQFCIILLITFLLLANGAVPVVAAESAASSISADTGTAGDPDAYLAQLRTALPQSWLQREFQRQRSFPAFAHSRQLVAKGQYEEAFRELEGYLASDPDDLVIQFGYLVLAIDLRRYHAVIGAANQILRLDARLRTCIILPRPGKGGLGRKQRSFAQDLAAAVDSKALTPADIRYARRSLAMAAVASPAIADALAFLEREEAKAGADSTLLVAKGQLLERLGHNTEAEAAYDEAVERSNDNDEKRAASGLVPSFCPEEW